VHNYVHRKRNDSFSDRAGVYLVFLVRCDQNQLLKCVVFVLHACSPAYAIPRILAKAGLTLQDVDAFELHEAFAVSMALRAVYNAITDCTNFARTLIWFNLCSFIAFVYLCAAILYPY
jgi:Thiolase, C-terminal domain